MMSDIGSQMLHELRRIRELLEQGRPLGFGKKQVPTFIFIRHTPESLWYTRDKHEGVNVPIPERDLTGFLRNVWRFDRPDAASGDIIPKLMVELDADRRYVIQTGLDTNFAKSFLAALSELEPSDLEQPLTLLVEDNAGGRGRPTVFARLEVGGTRLRPAFDRHVSTEALLGAAIERLGFKSPLATYDTNERP